MIRSRHIIVALFAAGTAHAVAPAPPLHAATTTCARHASPSGGDSGPGSAVRPYRSVRRLVAALRDGQVGCLAAGAVFAEDVRIGQGGRPGAPITLTSAPGGPRATIHGRLWVTDQANDVVISRLNLDGRNDRGLPSPTVSGDRVTFARNDVTNHHTGTCFLLGSLSGYGPARGVVIARNRIHNCGRLPATNRDHGIYVESSYDGRIVDNTIFDNADRGIQLYPNAQRTLVASNVIDGNGVGIIISGDDGLASSANVVRDNIIANSVQRANVEAYWPDEHVVGTGNLVTHNCLWNGRRGNVGKQVGFVALGTVVAPPGYVDRRAKRFALRSTSRCRGFGPR